MPVFNGEQHNNRFDIIAVCPNPESRRAMVGITFFREENQLETEAAQESIENAQEKLKACPPDCTIQCDLRNLAQATHELVLAFINSRRSQLPSATTSKEAKHKPSSPL